MLDIRPTDEQIAHQPQYVRDYIAHLESQINDLTNALNAAVHPLVNRLPGELPHGVYLDEIVRNSTNTGGERLNIPLGDLTGTNPRIRFVLTDGSAEHLDVTRTRGDGADSITVSGTSPIIVEPVVANSIRVTLR